MPFPVHTPRLNNNDDFVKVVRLCFDKGAKIEAGETIIEIETDKALFTVEAERAGYVIEYCASVDQEVAVGGILAWIGEQPNEVAPTAESAPAAAPSETHRPTAKALALLAEHGINPTAVEVTGDRLSAADVERHIAANKQLLRPLSSEERALHNAVLWHRDEAVPGYMEMEYDPAPWQEFAEDFQLKQRLMLSPLLALHAWRVVEVAKESRILNAAIIDQQRLDPKNINLGFTVQSGKMLYLAVLREADTMTAETFVEALSELQRRAMGRKLGALETQGATISFSSMARWPITRHMPILPPKTSLIIAHAAPPGKPPILGATYDHRLLTGADVALALKQISKPK
jgi:pyruvate/2-oxoglutarate dehydrogenase complex dihydrolipoamide acyltransferase (E2) component